jgi:hypothetical protein
MPKLFSVIHMFTGRNTSEIWDIHIPAALKLVVIDIFVIN